MVFDPQHLEKYPLQPGVYLMKNGDGRVLYVGKAKNLRLRLKQYFSPGRDGRLMVPLLIGKIAHIDIIVVDSEKEALLLENNLIKQYQPHFNALLKDDKGYVALALNHKHRWPKLQLKRYKGKPPAGMTYFGPYTSAMAAKATFDLLNKLFPLRQCSDQEVMHRTRPCILYDMKRCLAPCVGKCSPSEYEDHVQKNIKFLRGQDKEILSDLYAEMHNAAEALLFEKAQSLLLTIRQLETTIETQKVDKLSGSNTDVIGLFRQSEHVIVSMLFFREGSLIASRHYPFNGIAQDDTELIESLLIQHYEGKEVMAAEILIPDLAVDIELLSDLLSKGHRHKTYVLTPKKGEKKALVEMASKNAQAAFEREHNEEALRENALSEMQAKLHLKNYPRRIECFDNSHLAGGETVASLVAFTNGKKDGRLYRTYRIRKAAASDDYGALSEALTRRCKRGIVEQDLPDLLLVDGGKRHLNTALRVLKELDIINIDVVGVAKEEGRHDKGSSQEQLFMAERPEPILLKTTSPILFLIQQIRDEAHRTALRYHRKLRTKQTIKSSIEEIPGIGPKKRQLLLTHFGSIKVLRTASEEELRELKGLSQRDILAIRTFFGMV